MLPIAMELKMDFLNGFKKILLGTATDEEFVRHVRNNIILWDTRSTDYKGE
jgi:hypothetical protein